MVHFTAPVVSRVSLAVMVLRKSKNPIAAGSDLKNRNVLIDADELKRDLKGPFIDAISGCPADHGSQDSDVRSDDSLGSETSTSGVSKPAFPDSSEPGGRSRPVAW